jgi:PAB1-binding protein PBP1
MPSEPSGTIGGWDQFKANTKLLTVKATYDANQCTTALDKATIPTHFHDRAERLAQDIEEKTTDNIHIREERGLVSCAEDFNDDDKYSDVLYQTTTATPQDKPEPPPYQESNKEKVELSSSDNKEEATET